VQFSDLNSLLKEHGWGEPIGEENREALLSEEGITVDTALEDDQNKLIPISYEETSEHAVLCSTAAGTDHIIIKFNEACNELSVFTQPYQFLNVGKGEASDGLVSGTPGTSMFNDKEDIVLYNGQLMVDAGKNPVRIATKSAGIKID